MENLTKEQKYTIAKFYKLYMEGLMRGNQKREANHFKDSVTAQDDYFCDRKYEDFIHNCKVLINEGYLDGEVEDNKIYIIFRLQQKLLQKLSVALVKNYK